MKRRLATNDGVGNNKTNGRSNMEFDKALKELYAKRDRQAAALANTNNMISLTEQLKLQNDNLTRGRNNAAVGNKQAT